MISSIPNASLSTSQSKLSVVNTQHQSYTPTKPSLSCMALYDLRTLWFIQLIIALILVASRHTLISSSHILIVVNVSDIFVTFLLHITRTPHT